MYWPWCYRRTGEEHGLAFEDDHRDGTSFARWPTSLALHVERRILCFGFTFRAILTFEGMYERLRLIIVRKAFGCFRLVLGIGKPSIAFDNHAPLGGLCLRLLVSNSFLYVSFPKLMSSHKKRVSGHANTAEDRVVYEWQHQRTLSQRSWANNERQPMRQEKVQRNH